MNVRMESKEGTSRNVETKSRRYDVFLNHRGPDVRKKFVSHLDVALRGVGLRTFLDSKDIELGRDVDSSIDEALKGSCVFVAIFSERYAESRHCLNELCRMVELTQLSDSDKKILPVFYRVDPRHLRRIEDGPFEKGFRRHEEEETEEQILKWKEALCNISGKMGLELAKVNGNEAELVGNIKAAVRKLIPRIALPGDSEPVEHSNKGAQKEPDVTFNPGDRRLNILVLGDPKSVEAVISHICGADRQTTVRDHVNMRESGNSSSPMYLYSHTKGFNKNNFKDIRTFVKVRNEKWSPTEVEALWSNEVAEPGPRIRPASRTLFPDGTLRLHMVWFACTNLADLPNHLHWPKVTKKLCDLPVQILVIDKQRTQDLDMNLQKEFDSILGHGSDFFPHARKFMKDLIVKVALEDDDLKEELWLKCLVVKTRVEIENAANIIWEIRRKLGSAGKSFQRTIGGGTRSKEVSLPRSGVFVLNFLCAYWDIPQDSLRRVLQTRTNFISPAPDMKVRIESRKFVEFCLNVAAIIVYHTQESARKLNVGSESSLEQLLQREARDCYNSYFASAEDRPILYYDKMEPEEIRLFLERILERPGGSDPRPMESVDRRIRSSFISEIMKLIRPR